MVSIVGAHGMTVASTGVVTWPAWPAGTAVGDLAVMVAPTPELEVPAGWVSQGRWFATRLLSAADVAAPPPSVVATDGQLPAAGLVVLRGASGVGSVTSQAGATVAPGGAVVALGFGGDGGWSPVLPSSVEILGTVVSPGGSWSTSYGLFAEVSAGGWTSLATTSHSCGYAALPVVPATVPSAPSLVSPAVGTQVGVGAIALSWLHRSATGGAQDAARVRVRVDAGPWQWVTAAGGLDSSVVTLAQTGGSVTVTLTAGMWEWAVETGEGGWWSPLSPVWPLQVVTPPAVSADPTVSCPHGDLTPTVSWSATVGVGLVEVAQVAVTAAAATSPDAPLWVGSIPDPPASVSTGPLDMVANGSSCRAWLRVQQSGGIWSPWRSSAAFAVAWTAPAAPELSVTSLEPVTVDAVGVIDGIQWQANPGSGWADVLEATAPPLVWPRAPFGVATAYRARTWTVADGVRLVSDWSSPVWATSAETRHWLAAEDGSVMRPRLRDRSQITRAQGVTVSYGLPAAAGESRPWVDRTPPAGQSGDVTWAVDSEDDLTALLAWIEKHSVVWLCWPPTLGPSRVAVAPTRVAWAGPVQWATRGRFLGRYHVSIPWVEQ